MQEKIYEKLRNPARARAARAPCAEKVSISEMAASARTTKGARTHERARTTKLRLELIQHVGYLLVVMCLRCVFMPFLMDPDKTLH